MIASPTLTQNEDGYKSVDDLPHLRLYKTDSCLPDPRYATNGSLGVDVYCRMTTSLGMFSGSPIPLGLVAEIPKGFGLFVLPRSSLSRRGLMIPNGMGVIDRDYCGPDDELQLVLFNGSNERQVLERGERIGQLLSLRCDRLPLHIMSIDDNKTRTCRGGFGSTGTR